jgi:hypothetical protein
VLGVRKTDETRVLTLDQPTYACGPVEHDRRADEFDAP